jgi:hypothetical protein
VTIEREPCRIRHGVRGPHGPVRTPTHTSRPARVPKRCTKDRVCPRSLFRILVGCPFHELSKYVLNLVAMLATKLMRFEQMNDQLSGLAVIDLIDEMLQSSIHHGGATYGGSIFMSETRSVANHEPFLFEALQQGRDGRVGPVSSGPLELSENFANRAAPDLPKGLQHFKLSVRNLG